MQSRLTVLLLCLGLALALPACGSDDESASGTGADGPTAQPPAGGSDTSTTQEAVDTTAPTNPTTTAESGGGSSSGGGSNSSGGGVEGPSDGQSCPDVAFTDASDDGAFQVVVRNISCDEATALLKSDNSLTSYDCTSRPDPPGQRFSCVLGDNEIEYSVG